MLGFLTVLLSTAYSFGNAYTISVYPSCLLTLENGVTPYSILFHLFYTTHATSTSKWVDLSYLTKGTLITIEHGYVTGEIYFLYYRRKCNRKDNQICCTIIEDSDVYYGANIIYLSYIY